MTKKKVPAKRGRGRPSTYTREVADKICVRLANGETLAAICRDEGMPGDSTVINWALDDRDGFAERYAHARRIQHARYPDILDDLMREEPTTGVEAMWLRTKIDTYKWLIGKVLPKIYGDRVQVDGHVTVTHQMSEAERAARLRNLMSIAESRAPEEEDEDPPKLTNGKVS